MPGQETADEPRDLGALLLEREVPRVEEVELQRLQVAPVRLRALPGKISSFFPQTISVGGGAGGSTPGRPGTARVGAIILEEVELDLVVAGAVEVAMVELPGVWADPGGVVPPRRVLPLRGGERGSWRAGCRGRSFEPLAQ